MLSFEDARARLLAMAAPLGAVEMVALAGAAGRVLAREVAAGRDQPATGLSAMDGYAVRAGEAPGPWRVVGEVAAGAHDPGAIKPGEAKRIFTGAALPEGADAVAIQEHIARDGDHARLTQGALAPGDNVRPRGLDFRAGARTGGVGAPLSAARIGLAAAMGHGALPVFARPRVALLATGDELAPPGEPLAPGRIADAARPMLAALLARHADVLDCGIARDTPADLAAALARAEGADLLVTIGGASVGDHDLVRPAIVAAGGAVDFWRVAIRPGKPLMAGRLGATLVLGLPGNPASAFVTALLFVLPLVRALGGWAAPCPPERPARLGAPLPANGPRRDHLRATLSWDAAGPIVTPAPAQDSSLLSVLATAQALIIRAPHAIAAETGEVISMLDTDSAVL